MTQLETLPLRGAVEDAITVIGAKGPRLRAALGPVIESLEALCTTLHQSAAHSAPEQAHAGVLVVARDVLTVAIDAIRPVQPDEDAHAVLLALAGLHKRLVDALDACTSEKAHART